MVRTIAEDGLAIYVDDRQAVVYSDALLSLRPWIIDDALVGYRARYGDRVHVEPVYHNYGQWWHCAVRQEEMKWNPTLS